MGRTKVAATTEVGISNQSKLACKLCLLNKMDIFLIYAAFMRLSLASWDNTPFKGELSIRRELLERLVGAATNRLLRSLFSLFCDSDAIMWNQFLQFCLFLNVFPLEKQIQLCLYLCGVYDTNRVSFLDFSGLMSLLTPHVNDTEALFRKHKRPSSSFITRRQIVELLLDNPEMTATLDLLLETLSREVVCSAFWRQVRMREGNFRYRLAFKMNHDEEEPRLSVCDELSIRFGRKVHPYRFDFEREDGDYDRYLNIFKPIRAVPERNTTSGLSCGELHRIPESPEEFRRSDSRILRFTKFSYRNKRRSCVFDKPLGFASVASGAGG